MSGWYSSNLLYISVPSDFIKSTVKIFPSLHSWLFHWKVEVVRVITSQTISAYHCVLPLSYPLWRCFHHCIPGSSIIHWGLLGWSLCKICDGSSLLIPIPVILDNSGWHLINVTFSLSSLSVYIQSAETALAKICHHISVTQFLLSSLYTRSFVEIHNGGTPIQYT